MYVTSTVVEEVRWNEHHRHPSFFPTSPPIYHAFLHTLTLGSTTVISHNGKSCQLQSYGRQGGLSTRDVTCSGGGQK